MERQINADNTSGRIGSSFQSALTALPSSLLFAAAKNAKENKRVQVSASRRFA